MKGKFFHFISAICYYSSHLRLSGVFFGIPKFSICQVFESVPLHYENVRELSGWFRLVYLTLFPFRLVVYTSDMSWSDLI